MKVLKIVILGSGSLSRLSLGGGGGPSKFEYWHQFYRSNHGGFTGLEQWVYALSRLTPMAPWDPIISWNSLTAPTPCTTRVEPSSLLGVGCLLGGCRGNPERRFSHYL